MRDNAALITRIREGDKAARDTMVEENMGLVHSVVRRFVGRGYEKEDLVQIGAIGLIKAINKFDQSFNVQFSTYAVPMIMGEIKRFLRDDGMMKVSRTLKEISMKGRRAQEVLQKRLDREPSITEIAAECGVDPDMLMEAFEAVAPPDSIYASVYSKGEKEIQLMDTLASEDCEENIINKVMIGNLMQGLTSREQQIIAMRYFRGKTQAETARVIGVSQVQISRIEKKVIQTLRQRCGQEG